MAALQNTLDMLDYKCWFYERAQELGSIEAVKDLDGDALPERFQGVRRSLKSMPAAEEDEEKTNRRTRRADRPAMRGDCALRVNRRNCG